MDLLVALAQRAGHVMTRDELLREVWGARGAVSDEPLTRAVAELRKALGDDRADPAYIETIPKRGYRVIAKVGAVEARRAAAHAGPPLRRAASAPAAAAGAIAASREPPRWSPLPPAARPRLALAFGRAGGGRRVAAAASPRSRPCSRSRSARPCAARRRSAWPCCRSRT